MQQVRLPPEPRIQARLSWLLDNGASSAVSGGGDGNGGSVASSLYVSTAAAAFLCPRTSACVAADPDLLAIAKSILAKYGGGEIGSLSAADGTGQTANGTAKVLPLAKDLLRAAGERARARRLEGNSSGKKRPRDSSSRLCAEGGGGISSNKGTSACRGFVTSSPEVGVANSNSEPSHKNRSVVSQQQQLSPAVLTPVPLGNEHGARRRDRGCTVWETPRGVGLTPKTPSTRRGRLPLPAARVEDDGVYRADGIEGLDFPGSASSVCRQPRARGQTVWETPRGVGLTPRTPGVVPRGHDLSADGGEYGDDAGVGVENRRGGGEYTGSTSSAHLQPRARGQTVWETPRGVGLTPRTRGAAPRIKYSSPFGGENCDDAGGDMKENPGSASSVYQQPRARGQTVWETPRGVGLTPKTLGAARTTRSPISASQLASPAALSVVSGSSASPVVDGQREMRSYAQGRS